MRLAEQARMGRVAALSVTFVLLLPLVLGALNLPQPEKIEGVYVREGSRIVPRLLRSIKQNDGVLVLGTSETAVPLDGHNYWNFLNSDETVKSHFSVLSGAGWCTYVWFPIMLANRKSFSGLQVLYYLNPTYWRPSLNKFDNTYYDRYNSPPLVARILDEAKEAGVSRFVEPYWSKFAPQNGRRAKLSLAYQDFMTYYSYDLRMLATGGAMPKKNQRPDQLTSRQTSALQAGLDLRRNIERSYPADLYGFPDVSPSDFQYEALTAFVTLARKLGVKLVVFIGPYNGVLAQELAPDVLPHYRLLIEQLKHVLEESRTPYIDGSDLSYEPGTFIDLQHHSAYGGWRIEQKIAAYYRTH